MGYTSLYKSLIEEGPEAPKWKACMKYPNNCTTEMKFILCILCLVVIGSIVKIPLKDRKKQNRTKQKYWKGEKKAKIKSFACVNLRPMCHEL